jgi:hypothetical protein
MPFAPPPPGPIVNPEQLQSPLARLLVPLVRLLIRTGVTFPALVDLLRELYVNVAERDFSLPDKQQTDSRVSLLTGIHRKEVRRLRSAGVPISEVPAAPSQFCLIISRWLTSPETTDAAGHPRRLARAGGAGKEPTFDSLVLAQTSDVRPRAILDAMLAQGLVRLDEKGRVMLTEAGVMPNADGDALAYYFGRNLHDHIAAATANLTGGQRYLERAVHYDGLNERQAAELVPVARTGDRRLGAGQPRGFEYRQRTGDPLWTLALDLWYLCVSRGCQQGWNRHWTIAFRSADDSSGAARVAGTSDFLAFP